MKLYNSALSAIVAGVLFSQSACSNDKAQEVQKMELHSNQNLYAENNTKSAMVYEIIEVAETNDGKITDFSFLNEKGDKVAISSVIKNKYVFLNFWATWCPPCRAEIPAIISIQEDLKNKNFVVIGIALEREKEIADAIKKVEKYTEANKINYMNFVLSDELKKKLTNSYNGISGIPTTFFIDNKGDVVEKIVGGQEKEAFLEIINKMMK